MSPIALYTTIREIALSSAINEDLHPTEVGRAVSERWSGKASSDPAAVAARFLVHPNDSAWQDAIVRKWADGNPDNIKRGQSATILHHLHEQHGKKALERIRRMGRYGTESWEYIKQNYEELFGEENQVN